MARNDNQFRVTLAPDDDSGDAELKFNVRGTNFSGEEQQESQIDVTIGNSLVALADMIQVYHGTLVPNGSPATLIVMKFVFEASGNYRRFKNVEAKMTFSKADDATTAPQVVDITPKGTWAISRSKIPEETTQYVGICPCFPFILRTEVVGRCSGIMRGLQSLLYKGKDVAAHFTSSSASNIPAKSHTDLSIELSVLASKGEEALSRRPWRIPGRLRRLWRKKLLLV